MSRVEAELIAKLMCIDKAMYEILDEKTRVELMDRVSWLMLEFMGEDLTKGTIWENA